MNAENYYEERTTMRSNAETAAKAKRLLTLACEVYAYNVHRANGASTSWKVSEIPPIKERQHRRAVARAAELRVQIAEGVGSAAAAKTLRQIADQIEANVTRDADGFFSIEQMIARAHKDDAA
jgi:hypothetical protein